MMNIMKKHRNKLMTAVVISATVGIVLFALALCVAVWWRVTIFTGISVAFKFIFILAGVAVIPAGLYFLMKQKNNFVRFCKDSEIQRHDPKIMLISMIKYLIVVFIFASIVIAAYGSVLLVPLFIPVCFIIGYIRLYIKLWKAHGYSVLLLMCLSGITIVVSVLVSPAFRAAVWAIVDAFLRFSNV